MCDFSTVISILAIGIGLYVAVKTELMIKKHR